jgi:hypothetical protein
VIQGGEKYWYKVSRYLCIGGCKKTFTAMLPNMLGNKHYCAKGKSIFPNDESLQKMLYLATMDVLRKWTGRVQNWRQILLQLSVFFPDKVKSALV